MKAGDPVWVHFDGWAGRRKWAATLVRICPKRSRVRYEEECTTWRTYSRYAGEEANVPNYAITPRDASVTGAQPCK
jgi:hypothetical protein